MLDARELEVQPLVGPSRCECGNSAEGVYPCDSEGHKLASSDLVCCDRCDKITARETGQFFGRRSFAFSTCAGW